MQAARRQNHLILTRSQKVGLGSIGNSECLTRERKLTGSLELSHNITRHQRCSLSSCNSYIKDTEKNGKIDNFILNIFQRLKLSVQLSKGQFSPKAKVEGSNRLF